MVRLNHSAEVHLRQGRGQNAGRAGGPAEALSEGIGANAPGPSGLRSADARSVRMLARCLRHRSALLPRGSPRRPQTELLQSNHDRL